MTTTRVYHSHHLTGYTIFIAVMRLANKHIVHGISNQSCVQDSRGLWGRRPDQIYICIATQSSAYEHIFTYRIPVPCDYCFFQRRSRLPAMVCLLPMLKPCCTHCEAPLHEGPARRQRSANISSCRSKSLHDEGIVVCLHQLGCDTVRFAFGPAELDNPSGLNRRRHLLPFSFSASSCWPSRPAAGRGS